MLCWHGVWINTGVHYNLVIELANSNFSVTFQDTMDRTIVQLCCCRQSWHWCYTFITSTVVWWRSLHLYIVWTSHIILSIDKIMLNVSGWNSTNTDPAHMLFPFWFSFKFANLSLKLTEPTSKPAQLYQPRHKSVFHLCVKAASFLVVDKSCYFKMIIQ